MRQLWNLGQKFNTYVRSTFGLGLFVLASVWMWRLSTPISTSVSDSFGFKFGSQNEVQPRLNTTWHEQIALEMATDKTELTAVQTPFGVLNRTRVALLIEDRPLRYLIPLLLHFISVVPREWSFRFMGSADSLAMMEDNPTIRRYVKDKKLFLDLIPYNLVPSVNGYGQVNHLLTRPWLYEEWMWPAEWFLLFQDDSMICSASNLTLNDFVDEGWSFIGGSGRGTTKPHSTSGGLSLRYVPHLIKQLQTYSFEEWARDGHIASEDYYFSMALWDLPGAKMPIGTEAIRFGMVIHWDTDPYLMPMGFHAYSSDGMFRGPDGQKNQDKAYKYCPELAIISVGRWDCQCSPNPNRPGGLGG